VTPIAPQSLGVDIRQPGAGVDTQLALDQKLANGPPKLSCFIALENAQSARNLLRNAPFFAKNFA
jgi:hypothetical protein